MPYPVLLEQLYYMSFHFSIRFHEYSDSRTILRKRCFSLFFAPARSGGSIQSAFSFQISAASFC